MALDTTMDGMDIDMSEYEDPEVARMQREAAEMDARAAEMANNEAMRGVEEAPEEGEVDSNEALPYKVHIRGLDQLNHYEIQEYASEHYPVDKFNKIEWIDDTSANLVYDTPEAGNAALAAFSAEDVSEPLQIRAAKMFNKYPNVELQVRQAIVADAKVKGAKDRSRFYLMNPSWDPDNPDNIRPSNKRRRSDDGYGHRKYRRREYESDNRRRRGSRDREPKFHEDLYGDDPQAAPDTRRNSYSSGSEYSRRRRNEGGDLFANRQQERLRDRSASPARTSDGRYGFEDTQPHRQTARARSRTPPGVRERRDNRLNREMRKELFPGGRGRNSALANGNGHGSRPSSANSNRELFPDKVNSTVHRRQEGRELSPDEVAHAMGRHQVQDHRHSNNYSNKNESRDLFSRISGGPEGESSYGRLKDDNSNGFSVKGAGDAGFSILGASSKERVQSPLVKELFPLKSGNGGGRELFDGKIKSRARRPKAGDYM